MKITKRSIVKEIAQFAKIEGLCIVAAIVVYMLHSICSLLLTKQMFSIGSIDAYRSVACFFRVGWVLVAIENYIEDKIVLEVLYYITLGVLWAGICLGAVLYLSARLIGHNQITAKKLVLPVVGSAVLVCVCSVVCGLWLLMFRKSMSYYTGLGIVHTVMCIAALIVVTVLCLLILVCRSLSITADKTEDTHLQV